MATREYRPPLLYESDCGSISEDDDDANSLKKEKHESKRWTDLTAKDLDPLLTNYVRPLPVELATIILSRISGRALLNVLPTCKDW